MTFLKHNETVSVGNSIAAGGYSFASADQKVTVQSKPDVSIFLKIINLTTDTVIYDPQVPGLGGTQFIDENLIVVDYDTTTMSIHDQLLILYAPVEPMSNTTLRDVLDTLKQLVTEVRINNKYLSLISGDEVDIREIIRD